MDGVINEGQMGCIGARYIFIHASIYVFVLCPIGPWVSYGNPFDSESVGYGDLNLCG